ncbi:hypothetical protein [Sphingomonas sp.]|jgi:hypothetical protein|uniref:hypothetical protein n=1 Tax=Sphingomonas sp. TaxID=28214 RepID=UPI0035C82B80
MTIPRARREAGGISTWQAIFRLPAGVETAIVALWSGLLAHQLHTRSRGIRPAAGRVPIRLLEAAGNAVPIGEAISSPSYQ